LESSGVKILVEWAVYIIRCRTGQFYTGHTSDIGRRLKEHNRGIGSKFTRGRLPVALVYKEACSNRSDAMKRERYIKRMTVARKLSLMEGCRNG
jgi:putative endonuclease